MALEKTVEHIVPPTVPVINKVDAGDSMVAGIVLSLARGMLVCEAVRFGVAAGTSAGGYDTRDRAESQRRRGTAIWRSNFRFSVILKNN
jgi:fructose-1-phosphate kinase PfkB-like protein